MLEGSQAIGCAYEKVISMHITPMTQKRLSVVLRLPCDFRQPSYLRMQKVIEIYLWGLASSEVNQSISYKKSFSQEQQARLRLSSGPPLLQLGQVYYKVFSKDLSNKKNLVKYFSRFCTNTTHCILIYKRRTTFIDRLKSKLFICR